MQLLPSQKSISDWLQVFRLFLLCFSVSPKSLSLGHLPWLPFVSILHPSQRNSLISKYQRLGLTPCICLICGHTFINFFCGEQIPLRVLSEPRGYSPLDILLLSFLKERGWSATSGGALGLSSRALGTVGSTGIKQSGLFL